MAATPPGITKVDLVGRKGRNGKRTGAGTCYEVKAYDRQTKQTVYVGRYPNVDEAKNAKREFEETHANRSGGRMRLTFQTLVEAQYLKRTMTLGRKPTPIKDSTIKTNRYALQSFLATFGSTRIDRLDEDVLVVWCETEPGYVVEGVRSLFTWAVKKRWLAESPMRFVESQRTDGRAGMWVVATHDLDRLVAAARSCWAGLMGLRLSVLLVLLAYTGMRPSEAFALRPEHIDLEARRIHVHWQLDEYGKFQPLKNRRKRTIVMDPAVANVLPRLLAYVAPDDLLFRTTRGAKFNTKSKWSYYWDPIRKKIGLNGMDVYELRHYCATILLRNGAMPEDIALQLGHSDFGDLVRKLYGHPDDDLQLERLEHIMRNRTIPIAVRVTPEPPTDLDHEQLAA